jgi:hypothetical protein
VFKFRPQMMGRSTYTVTRLDNRAGLRRHVGRRG